MKRYKSLNIIGKYSPPFRNLRIDEEEKIILHEQNLQRQAGKVSYYELRLKNSKGERVDT